MNGKKEAGLKKYFLTVLVVFCVNVGIGAEEIFNKQIVETFTTTSSSGMQTYYAGVDITGDGFTDLFIFVPRVDRLQSSVRLSGFLKEGAIVSFDNSEKVFSQTLRGYTLNRSFLLEINGRSVLQIFPSEYAEDDFPAEYARQQRLRSQSNVPNR